MRARARAQSANIRDDESLRARRPHTSGRALARWPLLLTDGQRAEIFSFSAALRTFRRAFFDARARAAEAATATTPTMTDKNENIRTLKRPHFRFNARALSPIAYRALPFLSCSNGGDGGGGDAVIRVPTLGFVQRHSKPSTQISHS